MTRTVFATGGVIALLAAGAMTATAANSHRTVAMKAATIAETTQPGPALTQTEAQSQGQDEMEPDENQDQDADDGDDGAEAQSEAAAQSAPAAIQESAGDKEDNRGQSMRADD